MLEMDVRNNIREVQGFTDRLMKDQVPYATSQAINDVAFGIRTQIVTRAYPSSFDMKNRRFPGYMNRVAKATKRNLEASVGAIGPDRQSRADMLHQHETGKDKRPRLGKHIAVPNEDQIQRTASGKIRASQRPRRVMEQKRVFKLEFKNRQGRGAIFRRVTKGKDGIVPLYFLVPEAEIEETFPFTKIAHQVAVREIGPAYRKHMTKAIQTAKPPQGRRV